MLELMKEYKVANQAVKDAQEYRAQVMRNIIARHISQFNLGDYVLIHGRKGYVSCIRDTYISAKITKCDYCNTTYDNYKRTCSACDITASYMDDVLNIKKINI